MILPMVSRSLRNVHFIEVMEIREIKKESAVRMAKLRGESSFKLNLNHSQVQRLEF